MTGHVLRVLSWNVHDLRAGAAAVSQVLRELRPDVACLQEAPRGPLSRHRLASLAAASGLLFTAGGRPSAGVATLTSLRVDVRTASAVPLPVAGLRWGHRPTRPRGYTLVALRLPGGGAVAVANVHLGLSQTERDDHVQRLRSHLQALGTTPLVVAGDLNEKPGGPSWSALGAGLLDAGAPAGHPTFPAWRPRARIDAVLVDCRLEVLAAGPTPGQPAGLAGASDHLPVLVEIRLPADPARR